MKILYAVLIVACCLLLITGANRLGDRMGRASFAAMLQGGFDSALTHNHVNSLTYEGTWIKRQHVPTSGQYPLGNQLAVRGAANEMWFYYGFQPTDGPLIATAEGTKTGRKVKVTYDPACFYATSITDLGAVPSPTPTPTPNPVKPPLKPCAVGEWCYWTWDATQDKRIAALKNSVLFGCDPGSIFQTGSYIYCQRIK